MTPNFINEAIFSFGEAMNLVKFPTSEEEYKKWATPYDGKSITKTWSEVLTKKNSLEAEWTANQYQRDRQYPQLGEQLDLLFHDMTAGKGTKSGEWYKAIAKVKADNPKG